MGRAQSLLMAVSVAWLGLAVSAGPASAVTPTRGVDHYPQDYVETFDWGAGASGAWLRNAFLPAAQDNFQGSINNSRSPDYDYSDGSANLVTFQLRAASACASTIDWYACTLYDGNGRWRQIIFAAEKEWCQETGTNSGCLDVQRVAIHELGHVAGLARSADNGGNDAHSTDSESWTVMRLSTPRNAATGWSTKYLQECDVIELQREYDVQSYAGDYANCIDALGGLTGGALTSVAVHNAPSTSIACPSEVVTLSGTLKLAVESTWGLFSGNPLTRTATLQRKPVISGAAWVNWVTLTTTNGNWSRAVAMTSGGWDFRLVFSGATRVAPSTSPTRRVQWTTTC